jgi:hypothetical protein
MLTCVQSGCHMWSALERSAGCASKYTRPHRLAQTLHHLSSLPECTVQVMLGEGLRWLCNVLCSSAYQSSQACWIGGHNTQGNTIPRVELRCAVAAAYEDHVPYTHQDDDAVLQAEVCMDVMRCSCSRCTDAHPCSTSMQNANASRCKPKPQVLAPAAGSPRQGQYAVATARCEPLCRPFISARCSEGSVCQARHWQGASEHRVIHYYAFGHTHLLGNHAKDVIGMLGMMSRTPSGTPSASRSAMRPSVCPKASWVPSHAQLMHSMVAAGACTSNIGLLRLFGSVLSTVYCFHNAQQLLVLQRCSGQFRKHQLSSCVQLHSGRELHTVSLKTVCASQDHRASSPADTLASCCAVGLKATAATGPSCV